MEKVKIRKCESIMDGKAHSIELADGRKATAWCDKVDCGMLVQAYDAMEEIEVELKPYKSQAGKEGLNVVAIKYDSDIGISIGGDQRLQTLYDAKQGNCSMNGQYQKSVEEEKIEGMPKPEEFGEADITSINAKSSVKIKKNSKGIGWEIKVVTGEVHLIEKLEKIILDDPPSKLLSYVEDLRQDLGVDESARRFRERTAKYWVEIIALELFEGWNGDGHPSEWLLNDDGVNNK